MDEAQSLDAPGFSQRLEAKLSDDGSALSGVSQVSRDGETWDDDLAVTWTRVAESIASV